MQEEKISVIIPVYNCEKYLERAVDSVVGQTYNNLQIILVDDGSTDKSSAICDSYTTLDKRIMVIHQNNQGVSAARNMALEMADGDFVMFLDSDDYLEKDACEILHDSIAPEESMCMCGHYIEKEHGGGVLN